MNINFEEIFIEHCAPLLAGIKASNLFSVKYEDYNELYEKIVILNQTLKKEGYKPSETSQHCTGEAVDIQVILITEKDVKIYLSYLETYNLIKLWVKMGVLSVDQCIQEASYNSKKMLWEYWVHISHSAWGKTRDRKQFLIYANGDYKND